MDPYGRYMALINKAIDKFIKSGNGLWIYFDDTKCSESGSKDSYYVKIYICVKVDSGPMKGGEYLFLVMPIYDDNNTGRTYPNGPPKVAALTPNGYFQTIDQCPSICIHTGVYHAGGTGNESSRDISWSPQLGIAGFILPVIDMMVNLSSARGTVGYCEKDDDVEYYHGLARASHEFNITHYPDVMAGLMRSITEK